MRRIDRLQYHGECKSPVLLASRERRRREIEKCAGKGRRDMKGDMSRPRLCLGPSPTKRTNLLPSSSFVMKGGIYLSLREAVSLYLILLFVLVYHGTPLRGG